MQSNLRQPTFHDDLEIQALVLDCILGRERAIRTSREILLEICLDLEDFGARDGVERALDVLVRKGLLIRQGSWYAPSSAALHFHSLPFQ